MGNLLRRTIALGTLHTQPAEFGNCRHRDPGNDDITICRQRRLSKLERIRWEISTALSYIKLRRMGVTMGSGVRFLGLPIVTRHNDSEITLGDRVVLTSKSSGTALGVRSAVILRTLTSAARIRIGDDTGMSGAVVCAAKGVSIGKRCLIGADCMVFDTDFHNHEPTGRRYARPEWDRISASVSIEDDVFLGTRSIVCKGVTIGRGSIVAAGSVVTEDVPPMSIAAGVPAKIIRRLPD
jgi:acetyltransferase-like isoleucine patch superfamily enzyme